MPHSPLATSEILTQVTPRMFSPSIDTIASVSFFDHLMLLLGIEQVLKEMNLQAAKTLRELRFILRTGLSGFGWSCFLAP
jgi:hypothetical protein